MKTFLVTLNQPESVYEPDRPDGVLVRATEGVTLECGRLIFHAGIFPFSNEVAAFNAGEWRYFSEVTQP